MKVFLALLYLLGGLLSVSVSFAEARETSKINRRNEKLRFTDRTPASNVSLNIKRQETKLNFNSLIDENGKEAGALRESISDDVEVPVSVRDPRDKSALAVSDDTNVSNERLEVDMGMGDAGVPGAEESERANHRTQVNTKEDLFFEESMELSEEDSVAGRTASSIASTDRPSLSKSNSKRPKTKIAPN